MYRLTLSQRRAVYRLAGALMLGALAACTEPTVPAAPTSPTTPSAIIIIGGHPIVLVAQLRTIGNPNEIGNPDGKPLSAVVGTIQLKITGTEETGLVVSWQAHFANPECSASTLGGGEVYIQDSEEKPAFRLLPPGTPLGCGDNFLEGSSPIPDELAALMIEDPEDFVAAFYLGNDVVIAGSLRLAGSDPLETR